MDEEIIEAVLSAKTYLDVAKKLGISRQMVVKTCLRNDVDVSHFLRGRGRMLPIDKVFIVHDGTRRNGLLVGHVLRRNLIPYVCNLCGIGPIWNGKELTLQLDHINGINNDDRISNLRFLCPNCHSQTETYKGRKSKGPRKKRS